MKKIVYGVLACFLAMVLVQCKSTQVSNNAPKVDYLTKSDANAKFTTEQLAKGKEIWEGKCQKCHKLIGPETYDAQKWKPIIDRMIPKAKLEEQDGELVRAYLVANCK